MISKDRSVVLDQSEISGHSKERLFEEREHPPDGLFSGWTLKEEPGIQFVTWESWKNKTWKDELSVDSVTVLKSLTR